MSSATTPTPTPAPAPVPEPSPITPAQADAARDAAREPAPQQTQTTIAVVAPRSRTKHVKTLLQTHGLFGRSIRPADTDAPDAEPRFLVYTTLTAEDAAADAAAAAFTRLRALLGEGIQLRTVSCASPNSADSVVATSPLVAAASAFIHAHPPPDEVGTKQLLDEIPRRYSVYPPLLLLPASAFASDAWRVYLRDCALAEQFFSALARSVGATHVARNAPIPPDSVMRSPRIERLFGFPDALSSQKSSDPDTAECSISNGGPPDFGAALWVCTVQNGIYQTWAPEHTMFSRGNIREKARLLREGGMAEGSAVEDGVEVADLYAGIGYFVFSYLAAGAKRVWAWEINPWSVEALVRGCAKNGWRVHRVPPGADYVEEENKEEEKGEMREKGEEGEVRCVVFEESNEHALSRLEKLGKRGKMAHVNLGLLPSSRASWPVAARLVRRDGGVVHVHENVRDDQVQDVATDVARAFERLAGGGGSAGGGVGVEDDEKKWEEEKPLGNGDAGAVAVAGAGAGAGAEVVEAERGPKAWCEHVERVKTFAPGVVHCVFDVRFGG